VKARLPRLLAWLAAGHADVVCLQELKTAREGFPFLELEAAGWHAAGAWQPTYNGVAILARQPPEDVAAGLDDGEDDPQARLVAATVGGVRVVSVYVPNGQEPDSDKFAYKLRWLDRLAAWIDRTRVPGRPLAICGDFNIVPRDGDAPDPAFWNGTVLLNPAVRARLQALLDRGLVDVAVQGHPAGGPFSWWDYRMLAFPKNLGLRIDLVLASADLAARCTDLRTDRDERKGEKPSDHAPVIATFRD
jgi:exodeoxyribonuclease III